MTRTPGTPGTTAATAPATAPPAAGLREAHAHILQHGRVMNMLPLGASRDRGECMQLVAEAESRMRERGDRGWMLGAGLRVQAWADRRYPTAADLDAITGDRPAALWSFDHHAIAANSAAMCAAGINDRTRDPPLGRIERDPRSGAPTGLLLESAAHLVRRAIPEPDHAEAGGLARRALADLMSHGFVEIHDLMSQPTLGPTLSALHVAGHLPLGLQLWLYPLLDDVAAAAAAAAGPTGWARPGLRLAGAKVFADGTLNSRTASMLAPFADPLPGLPNGQAMMDVAALLAALHRVESLGMGLAVHAIGDAAVRSTLDAFERFLGEQERVRRARARPDSAGPVLSARAEADGSRVPMLRIEHAEIIDEADVPRFARLGVVASVQPCHLLADIEALRRGLPLRLERVLPLRDLIGAGCGPGRLLWFGSDTPIVRPHPEDSLQAAVERRRVGLDQRDAIAWRQRLTAEECREAFRPTAG